MPARRVSADDQAPRRYAVAFAFSRQPIDGLPTLFHDVRNANAGTEIVIDDCDADAFGDE